MRSSAQPTRKPGRVKRAVRRARPVISVARAHARLARAVLRGELSECGWDALKAVYFRGTTEEACIAQMVQWADQHGIVLVPERRRVQVGTKVLPHYVVRFRARPIR
jgi:hypothetical protein